MFIFNKNDENKKKLSTGYGKGNKRSWIKKDEDDQLFFEENNSSI